MDGHGASRCVDADNRVNFFLDHVLIDQEVTGLDELSGSEAPFVSAADHERMLGRGLEAAVDDHEALVFAESDTRDPRGNRRRAVQPVM